MIQLYTDPLLLAAEFSALACSIAIKDKDVSIDYIAELINCNLRLIMDQTENALIAPFLKETMLNLSFYISKEKHLDTTEGRDLAFRIMCYAQGIFNKGAKPDWQLLPTEILEFEIFPNLTRPNHRIKSGLSDTAFVSTVWNRLSTAVKIGWVNTERITMFTFGCLAAKEAVDYLIRKPSLKCANLTVFIDLTNEDLTTLAEKRPDLVQLFIDDHHSLITGFPISKLKQLEDLCLIGCDVIPEEVLAEELLPLTKLKGLSLAGCKQVTGEELAGSISKHTNLTHLILDDCCLLTEEVLANILSHLPNLKCLSLLGCELLTGEKILASISAPAKLTWLNLDSCENIKLEKCLDSFSKYTNLTWLNLHCCAQIPGKKLADTLHKFNKLTYLNLGRCDQIPEEELTKLLPHLVNLEYLYLYCYDYTGMITKPLSLLVKLITLELTGLRSINIERLAVDISGLTKLRTLELYLSGADEGDKSEIAQAISRLTNLEILTLFNCNYIPEDNFAEAMEHLTKLRSFYLNGYNFKTQKLIQSLSKLKNLSYLNFSCCANVDERELAETLSKLTKLETFFIWQDEGITGSILVEAFPRLPNLTNLALRGFDNITITMLSDMIPRLPSLICLDVFGCSQITEEKVKELQEKFPFLDIDFDYDE